MNELEKLQQENAALLELITELANEMFLTADDGSFTAHGSDFHGKLLATRVNRVLGIGKQVQVVSGKNWNVPLV